MAIGDSLTDFNMALQASSVFARDRLAEYLDEQQRPYTKWDIFLTCWKVCPRNGIETKLGIAPKKSHYAVCVFSKLLMPRPTFRAICIGKVRTGTFRAAVRFAWLTLGCLDRPAQFLLT